MRTVVVAALLTVGMVAPAYAQDSQANPATAEPPQPEPAATTHFDFEDDQVEGDIQRPDGELISSIEKAKEASLIELRTNFVPEIVKMIDDLP